MYALYHDGAVANFVAQASPVEPNVPPNAIVEFRPQPTQPFAISEACRVPTNRIYARNGRSTSDKGFMTILCGTMDPTGYKV